MLVTAILAAGSSHCPSTADWTAGVDLQHSLQTLIRKPTECCSTFQQKAF